MGATEWSHVVLYRWIRNHISFPKPYVQSVVQFRHDNSVNRGNGSTYRWGYVRVSVCVSRY